jgi:hypothetical protein
MTSSFKTESRDTSVGIGTGYGLDGRCSIPGGGKISLFPIRSRPALGPTLTPIQWEPRTFPWGHSGRGVKLIAILYLVPRSRMVELYLHSPICLHGLTLN